MTSSVVNNAIYTGAHSKPTKCSKSNEQMQLPYAFTAKLLVRKSTEVLMINPKSLDTIVLYREFLIETSNQNRTRNCWR